MAGGAGGEGSTASGSALCPSAGPSQSQCPHTTFPGVFTESPTQRWVRKSASSQLLQHLQPKAWACQSSQDTTRGLLYKEHIKNLKSNFHAHGSHYRHTGSEEPSALMTPRGRAEGKDTPICKIEPPGSMEAASYFSQTCLCKRAVTGARNALRRKRGDRQKPGTVSHDR